MATNIHKNPHILTFFINNNTIFVETGWNENTKMYQLAVESFARISVDNLAECYVGNFPSGRFFYVYLCL